MSDLMKYAKALVLLGLIVCVAILQFAFGMEIDLDLEHYIGLLIADFMVWLVPNKDGE